MKKKHIIPFLKIIGILVFGWIIYHIDISRLRSALADVNYIFVGLSLLSIIGICYAKTRRWHALVRATGMHPTFKESWHLYFIGIFLGNITPAKIGELGRAAYLKKRGLPLKIGLLLSVADRAADAIAILLLGIIGLGMFGWIEWMLIAIAILVIIIVIVLMVLSRKLSFRLSFPIIKLFFRFVRPHLLSRIALYTLLAWTFYFVWGLLLAYSLGIDVRVHILIATFTITGLFSMLPIAPSGLGTRDAALVLLLAPYGITAEKAVALALLMFVSILLMSVPGIWYWMKSKD